jgi:hypothetical protein
MAGHQRRKGDSPVAVFGGKPPDEPDVLDGTDKLPGLELVPLSLIPKL